MAPSRADATTERKAIIDAALRVMRKNGYDECQITDILSEASLSTRAFYRHFKTKDDVLIAIYRDNAETTSRRLAEKVAAAGPPQQQLQVWIEETLNLGYDRRRASRVLVLASGAARRATGYAEEQARAAIALSAPLLEALEAGKASGAFPKCEPAADAVTIHDIVWRFVGEALSGKPTMTEQAARDHVMRFCLPALGVRRSG
jgi:AcrR family transcriptional regulator